MTRDELNKLPTHELRRLYIEKFEDWNLNVTLMLDDVVRRILIQAIITEVKAIQAPVPDTAIR